MMYDEYNRNFHNFGSILMQKFMLKQSTLLVAMTLVLTACGGGGSGSSTNTTTNSATPNSTQTKQPTSPQTKPVNSSVPVNNTGVTSTTPINNNPSTKPVQDIESPLALLNDQRKTCGFSTLAHNADLAKASQNHNLYMGYISEKTAKLGIFASHYEQNEQGWSYTGTANPYYSGTSVRERVKTGNDKGKNAVAVNYPFATSYVFEKDGQPDEMGGAFVTENIALFSHNASSSQLLRNLLASPYHLKSLVSQFYKDVGVHYHTSNEWTVKGYTPIKANYLTLVLGLAEGQSPKIANKTLSYPCAGISRTEHTITHESPDPFKGHSRGEISEKNPIGQPIYIIAPDSKTITNISNIDFKPVNGVVAPKVWAMFKNANSRTNSQHIQDPHGRLGTNEAFLIPNEALKPATTYQVSYKITYSDNSTQENNFTFTTKS